MPRKRIQGRMRKNWQTPLTYDSGFWYNVARFDLDGEFLAG